MTVLFEDDCLAVVVKPPGIPVQPDKSGDEDMTALLAALWGQAYCGVVHRLDRTVGGVMVFAKTPAAAARLSAAFAGDGTEKRYLAVGMGSLASGGVLTDYLLKNERLNVSKVVDASVPRAKKAVLAYDCLAQADTEADGCLSLFEIRLQTGRHHQIRVQMAHAGAALWGDTKYNAAFTRRRGVEVALWAGGLRFAHPITGAALAFDCPPEARYPFDLFGGMK